MKISMRVLAVTLSLSLFMPVYVSSAGAAAKAGVKCSKLGLTSQVKGVKFTCIKSGKKLVWNKGVTTSVAQSTTSTVSNLPSQVPTRSTVTYFRQWKECDEATGGHDGWVVGRNDPDTLYVFLQCMNSHREDGSPIVVWQMPQDAAKIDQGTIKAIEGTGFIPKVYSNEITHPDWYSFTEANHAQAPTSFTDLYANRRGIAYSAWTKLIGAVSMNSSQLPNIETYVGPNSKPYSTQASQTITLIHKVMASNNGLKRVKIYYYNRQDQLWAASEIEKSVGTAEVALAMKNLGGPLAPCYGTTDCNNSGAWTTSDGTGYIYMGVPNTPNHRNLAATGEPGEYFHAAWRYFFAKQGTLQAGPAPSIFPSNQPPFWLNIAYEEIASNFAESNGDFRKYKSLSLGNSSWISNIIPDANPVFFDEYLSIKNLGARWSDAHSGVPNNQASLIGPRIGEIFIALKGPIVVLDFYDRMSRGESFESAFEANFGISWSKAAPEISRVLVDEFSSDY